MSFSSSEIDRDQQTLCAVSTPPGRGGVSVIRISGPQSLNITKKIAPFLPSTPESHRVYFGTLLEKELNSSNSLREIDEVLVTYFEEGRSFTGDEVVEISCHGSPLIVEKILRQLISVGAVTARRGEFTYRAFMNQKLDLVQAESVLSLIESRSDSAQRLALRQLKGVLSENLQRIEDQIIWLLAHLEASIDFSTEGLEIVSEPEVVNKLSSTLSEIGQMIASYQRGKKIREGLHVTLIGIPNVGKSSLLNLLVEENRAIVTDIPGTTRDLIEAEVREMGVRIVFSDTAGLRHLTNDPIEALGIERTKEAQKQSDFNIFVFDLGRTLIPEEVQILNDLDPEKTFIIGNKKDLLKELPPSLESLPQFSQSKFYQKLKNWDEFEKSRVFFVSALDKNDREKILAALVKVAGLDSEGDEVVVSQTRHFELLNKAFQSLEAALRSVEAGRGAEFIALELKEALLSVQEVLGKYFDDQILDRVFKEFCLGK